MSRHICETEFIWSRGKAVGRHCATCGKVFTIAGNLSQPIHTNWKGVLKRNKAHERRMNSIEDTSN